VGRTPNAHPFFRVFHAWAVGSYQKFNAEPERNVW
jgi:hypothetical protein